MPKKNNGIWIGENATIAIVDDYRISFLRIKKDLIISVLSHNAHGTVGVVYGFGINFDAHAFVSIKDIDSCEIINNTIEANSYIENHSKDIIEYDEVNKCLIYITYDGIKYNLKLSEKIDMNDFGKKMKLIIIYQ